MVAIPPPINHTVDEIYRALAAARGESYEGLGVSISNLGEECDRAIWYGFRWASPPEVISGLKAITFETGDIEEQRLLNSLRLIGVEVVDVDERGKQVRYTAANGHIRGKSDASALGLPEAPKTWHIVECKSMKETYWKKVQKEGVKKGYYSHWVQTNSYGHLGGYERCLYLCRNKNTGEIYAERWATDHEEAIRLIARAERIIHSPEPSAKLHEDPTKKVAFKCKALCRHLGICHESQFPRVSCRTCIHATPEKHGDAAWSCARWAKPLSLAEQKAGCPAHLFVPATVPGEILDTDEDAETITYRLASGAEWVDGAGKDSDASNTTIVDE